MKRIIAFSPLLAIVVLAGCSGSTTSPESAHRFIGAPLITAPPGTRFMVLVNGVQLARQIRLTVNDNGQLTANGNGILAVGHKKIFSPNGTLIIPPDARFLRLAPDGTLAVRNYQQDGYTTIGQLPIVAAQDTKSMTPVTPGSDGIAPLEPALFAITRQGDKIRLVPVG